MKFTIQKKKTVFGVKTMHWLLRCFFKIIPVLGRSNTHDFFEDPIEMRNIVVAHCKSDFGDIFIGMGEQPL
jgi:hypothetical protein